MMRLRLQMLAPLSARCSWILRCRRVRRSLQKCCELLAAADMAPLRSGTELARVHVLDHALAQRADRIRTHGKLLSWMRLKTPRYSRQGVSPATDDLSRGESARDRARRAAGYRASDLVHWPLTSVRCAAAVFPESEVDRTRRGHQQTGAHDPQRS